MALMMLNWTKYLLMLINYQFKQKTMGVILFIIAYILFLPLTIFNALNVRKKGYLKDTAINIDRFGNREFRFSLNKYLIIEGSINKFGDIRETISSVLGKNQRDNTLTKLCIVICCILDAFDEKHCKNSIQYYSNDFTN